MESKTNYMRRLLLLPLILIVLTSGCTIDPGPIQATGPGVVVKNFVPDFPEVSSTEEVSFIALIQNTGSNRAEYVKAEILGLEEWELVGYKYPECASGFDLIQADAHVGTSGEIKTCSWVYEAPQLPPDISLVYEPVLRVYYNYMSNTVSSISIVPRNELRRLQNSGQSLPVDVKSSTSGPLTISIQTEPILSFEPRATFPVTITVANNEGGIACYLPDCTKNTNWNKVLLNFDLDPMMSLVDCSDMELTLYKGKSNSITCKVEVFDIPEDTISKRTISVTATYDYMIEKSAEVKVKSSL